VLDDVRFDSKTNPFQSFWMARYECSEKINAFGHRVELQSTTGHLPCIHEDYQLLSLFNMRKVREGIPEGVLIVTSTNEVSFLSWLGKKQLSLNIIEAIALVKEEPIAESYRNRKP
jgi:hypothetical protein